MSSTISDRSVDVVVVGAGIVGLATARAVLQLDPSSRVVVLDKEDRVAAHQSGRNSGVIHAGVYYAPGSAKARLCREGRDAMLDFCAEHGIAHEVCGKLVVATSADELDRLEALRQRCLANGIEVRRLDRRAITELEPYVDGIAALHVPATGIVDFGEVARVLAGQIEQAGAEVRLSQSVEDIIENDAAVRVLTSDGVLRASTVVNCAGLHSDRLAERAQAQLSPPGPLPAILPFRGEYAELRPHRRYLVRNLIYPVPDPRFPFLGAHFTRDIHGGVHAGPNAVPALGREAYRWGTVIPGDVIELLRRRSTWQLGRRYWRTEVGEVVRSISRRRFVRALQRLIPDVTADDLVPAPAGIRAQAVSADGMLLDDFAFASTPRTLHVLNAPSPAATASLAIGAEIAARLASH